MAQTAWFYVHGGKQQGSIDEEAENSYMTTPSFVNSSRPLPRHVAVIGTAGGLGQGILSLCRTETIAFTAIVRSRAERIKGVPGKSRVVVVTSLADRAALTEAFLGQRKTDL